MAGLDELPQDLSKMRVLGTADAARFCNFSVPHWRRMVRAGEAPRPLKLSERKIGWQVGDLCAWLEGKKQPEAA
jgi:prophage regulatory protein